MADIVGLISSVLQLVDTVARARDYIEDFRNAPHDQQQLLLEVQSLQPLIEELEERTKNGRAAGPSGGMHEFQGSLVQLKGAMERLAKKLDPTGGIRKVSSRLTWSLWGKEDVLEGLRTIERFKSLLIAWLGMDISTSVQDIISALKDAAQNQIMDRDELSRSVSDVAWNQHIIHYAEKRAEIIEWCSPLNFFLRQADIFGTRHPGTGEWLLTDNEFTNWKLGTGRTLWCRGMPGAGKTVLCSIVVNHLRTEFARENIGVAVIYLNHKETAAQSLTNLLAGLWRQLIFKKPLPPALYQLYEEHREPGTRLSLAEIHSVLRSTFSAYSKVFLLVDALDEYPEEERETLLRKLCTAGPTVNLLLISRPHIAIGHVVAHLDYLEIRATENDIREYVNAQILKSSRLSGHMKKSSDLKAVIEAKIIQRSDGMFLLAKLHIDSLTSKQTVRAVREALDSMQSNLNRTYDEIMDRIDGQGEEDRILARRTLSWVSNAKRPLHVSELVEALAIEPSVLEIDPDNILDLDIILSVCAGLVIVDEEDDLVRLVHYTTQVYLDAKQGTAFPNAQTEITAACIAVKRLQARNKQRVPGSDEQPPVRALDDYAWSYCLVHAHGQPERLITDDILHFLTQACGSDIGTTYMKPGWIRWEQNLPSYPSRLCVAAGFDLREIVTRLLADVKFDENALTAAIIKGHTDTVRLLIERGGNLNSALREASEEGHEDIVRLLLKNGADINRQNNQSSSALQVASFRGRDKVVRLLIENGADVNAPAQIYGTALQVASINGHYEIVEILLLNKADVNLRGEPYGTALHAASLGGNADIASLLIRSGAEIDACTERHGTALAAAFSCGRVDVARLLVNHGAGVNDPGARGWTILGLAAAKEDEEVVRLLLANGADVNAKSGGNNTALQAASFGGQDTIAALLIQHGADVNAAGGEYGTALEIASRLGRTSVVRTLLKNGADINQNGGKCIEEASSWGKVSSWGHKEVVRLLIEHGAVVDRVDGSNSGLLNV